MALSWRIHFLFLFLAEFREAWWKIRGTGRTDRRFTRMVFEGVDDFSCSSPWILFVLCWILRTFLDFVLTRSCIVSVCLRGKYRARAARAPGLFLGLWIIFSKISGQHFIRGLSHEETSTFEEPFSYDESSRLGRGRCLRPVCMGRVYLNRICWVLLADTRWPLDDIVGMEKRMARGKKSPIWTGDVLLRWLLFLGVIFFRCCWGYERAGWVRRLFLFFGFFGGAFFYRWQPCMCLFIVLPGSFFRRHWFLYISRGP